MTETAEQKKQAAMEAAAKKAQEENAKAKEAEKLASDKKVEERTEQEQKAAAATAAAKVEQEKFDAAKNVEDEARKLAEKNDKKDDVPLNYADQIVAEKLAHGGSPEAVAAEDEAYVLKQQLYAQAGLSAPDVLATAQKAANK